MFVHYELLKLSSLFPRLFKNWNDTTRVRRPQNLENLSCFPGLASGNFSVHLLCNTIVKVTGYHVISCKACSATHCILAGNGVWIARLLLLFKKLGAGLLIKIYAYPCGVAMILELTQTRQD